MDDRSEHMDIINIYDTLYIGSNGELYITVDNIRMTKDRVLDKVTFIALGVSQCIE